MFPKNSRYAGVATFTVRTARGEEVVAIRLPIRAAPLVRSVHPRADGQRPDHVAAHYLGDATAFWRLCDAGGAIAPDALAVRARIAIPKKER
jgi:hypothetical protein